jgi:hypothetical protein
LIQLVCVAGSRSQQGGLQVGVEGGAIVLSV